MFDPARGYPSVAPYLRYSDPSRAIDWLIKVLGARVALKLTLPDGRIGHAEMVTGQSVIAVGVALAPPPPVDPREDRYTLRQMTLVFVEDVDSVVQKATENGGTVVDDATDQPWGLRQAVIRDPEGYLWEPSHHLRDVEPSAWGAELVSTLPG